MTTHLEREINEQPEVAARLLDRLLTQLADLRGHLTSRGAEGDPDLDLVPIASRVESTRLTHRRSESIQIWVNATNSRNVPSWLWTTARSVATISTSR